jgi:hypothetical protein
VGERRDEAVGVDPEIVGMALLHHAEIDLDGIPGETLLDHRDAAAARAWRAHAVVEDEAVTIGGRVDDGGRKADGTFVAHRSPFS